MMPQLVDVEGVRVLCVSEARGSLSQIEALASSFKAQAVVHVGSFGFFDGESALNMTADRLAFVANSSRVVVGSEFHNMNERALRESVGSQLSELSVFIAGVKRFSVPVYCVYGSCEDITVVEKFRTGVYHVDNLHLVDEFHAPIIEGTKLRLLGLPGQFDQLKLLDSGDGPREGPHRNVAGNGIHMWSTLWQLGELFHTARKTFDPKEVRVFLTETAPCDTALLQYIAILLRADLYLSGDQSGPYVPLFSKRGGSAHHLHRQDVIEPHSPFMQSYNISGTGIDFFEFTKRLNSCKDSLGKEWHAVKSHVKQHGQPNQVKLIESTMQLLTGVASGILTVHIERAYRSLWFFRLGALDATSLLLQYTANHQISMHAQSTGLDFSRRQSDVISDADDYASVTSSVESDEARSSNAQRKREKKERKEREIEEKKEKRRAQRERFEKEKAEPLQHGLWFRNGDRPTDEILGCLHEQDRQLNPSVVIKSTMKPQGGKTKVALVLFQTAEQASQAYDRVDKDEAGTVSIYQPELHKPRPFRKR